MKLYNYLNVFTPHEMESQFAKTERGDEYDWFIQSRVIQFSRLILKSSRNTMKLISANWDQRYISM